MGCKYFEKFKVGYMPDYFAAAQRHFDDGDFLHQHARHPNAVQLWAYGGECTLKAIALKQGYFQVGATGKPNNKFGQHLNENSALDLLSLYNAAQTGAAALMGPSTAFVGWQVSVRYEDGSQLQPNVAQYAMDAACFRNLLNAAIAGGLVP